MNINECAAVVTGGASGLGEATARALAAAGGKVTLFDLNSEQGESVASEIGGLFASVNVTDEESVKAGLKKAAAAHGEARILVNCAGISTGEKTVSRGEPISLEGFNKVIQVNLVGTLNCSRLAALRMSELELVNSEERGVIINTASVAAYEGQIGQVAYAASKAGVAGMTLPMARDLSRYGIRVVTIAPGLFITPMLAQVKEEIRQALGDSVPFPSRLGDPSEYAALAQHICENAMLNGEVIRLDGALRMQPR